MILQGLSVRFSPEHQQLTLFTSPLDIYFKACAYFLEAERSIHDINMKPPQDALLGLRAPLCIYWTRSLVIGVFSQREHPSIGKSCCSNLQTFHSLFFSCSVLLPPIYYSCFCTTTLMASDPSSAPVAFLHEKSPSSQTMISPNPSSKPCKWSVTDSFSLNARGGARWQQWRWCGCPTAEQVH